MPAGRGISTIGYRVSTIGPRSTPKKAEAANANAEIGKKGRNFLPISVQFSVRE